MDWEERALCRTSGRSPELWFPENRRAADVKRAKAFCRVCPVMDRCLTEALRVDDTLGIWGGLDEVERAALRRRRPLRVAG